MSLIFDLTGGGNSIGEWPDGAYAARILEAEEAIASSSGNPKLNLKWELYHPQLGTGILWDNVPVTNKWKGGNFYVAWVDPENRADLGERGEVDAQALIGAEFIVHIGKRRQTGGKYAGEMMHEAVPPFYSPITRTDLLAEGY